jgi:asparagine synthase (glutamine-hydrolysing)
MMYADGSRYLPDDILTKVDRASMGVSLETRVPMLDHNVVEFAWRLPRHMKVRGREAKWLLKQLLRKYIPAALIDRPKMGFGVPVNEWILGPLRDWAEDLVSEDRLRRDGLLNARLVRELWSRHVRHPAAEGDSMWQLLMLQSWLSARDAP